MITDGMERLGEADVSLAFRVSGHDGDGREAESEHTLRFEFDVHRTQYGAVLVRLLRTTPDDPQLRALVMRSPDIRRDLNKAVGQAVAEKVIATGQPVIIEAAEGF